MISKYAKFVMAPAQPVPSHTQGFYRQAAPAPATRDAESLRGHAVTIWNVYPSWLVRSNSQTDGEVIAYAVVTLDDASQRITVTVQDGPVGQIFLLGAEHLVLPMRVILAESGDVSVSGQSSTITESA